MTQRRDSLPAGVPGLPPGWVGGRVELASPAVGSAYRVTPARPEAGVVLTRSWRRPLSTLVLWLAFAGFSTSVGATLATARGASWIGDGGPSPRGRSLGIALHGLVALGCGWASLLRLVNKTTLRLEPGRRLSVDHGPLPSRRRRVSVATADIERLSGADRTVPGRPPSVVHDLVANLRDGRAVVLLRDLGEEEARAVLQVLQPLLERSRESCATSSS